MPIKNQMYKRTFFFDLDGTLFRHGTTNFLPGAKELLDKLITNDCRIIFVTRRGDLEFEGHPVYGQEATQKALKEHGLDKHTIIFDVMSPRYLVDDSEAYVVAVETNEGFNLDDFTADRD